MSTASTANTATATAAAATAADTVAVYGPELWTRADELARLHPETFSRPCIAEMSNLSCGDTVKISGGGERFWVVIRKIEHTAHGVVFTGQIDNVLVGRQEYNYESRVVFGLEHIYDCHLKAYSDAFLEEFRQLRAERGWTAEEVANVVPRAFQHWEEWGDLSAYPSE